MHRNKKTIQLSAGMPFGRKDLTFSVPWDDVYVTFKNRRKVVHWGPCFVSKSDIAKSLGKVEKQLREKYVVLGFNKKKLDEGDFDGYINNPSKRAPTSVESDKHRTELLDEREMYLDVLLAFENGMFVKHVTVEHWNKDVKKTPDIAVNVETLNRVSLERAVDVCLEQFFHVPGPYRFSWNKPKIFIQPV